MPDAHHADAEQLDPRTLRAHEALDFTPWLAANLGLLGEAVGLRLEPLAGLTHLRLTRFTRATVTVLNGERPVVAPDPRRPERPYPS